MGRVLFVAFLALSFSLVFPSAPVGIRVRVRSDPIAQTVPVVNDLARTAATTHADGIINVRAYGAVGDGVADDTAAIQAAIDAAEAAGGGTVSVPRGKYLISTVLTVPTGCHLVGEGSYLSILCVASNIGALIAGEDDDYGFSVRGIGIVLLDATGADTTTAAVTIGDDACEWEIDDVAVYDSDILGGVETGAYDFQDGPATTDAWTSTVKRFRCATTICFSAAPTAQTPRGTTSTSVRARTTSSKTSSWLAAGLRRSPLPALPRTTRSLERTSRSRKSPLPIPT